MRSYWDGVGPSPNLTDVLIRWPWEDRQTGRLSWSDDWSYMATKQETPEVGSESPEAREKDKERLRGP